MPKQQAMKKTEMLALLQKAADRSYATYQRNKIAAEPITKPSTRAELETISSHAYAEYVVYERMIDALTGRPAGLREAAGLTPHPEGEEVPAASTMDKQTINRLHTVIRAAADKITFLAGILPLDKRQEGHDAGIYARQLRVRYQGRV